MKAQLPDEAATRELAAAFAAQLPQGFGGWIVVLKGELGAGKSTFARALIGALGHEGPVPSPTYTLVEPYTTSAGTVYHIDLYRVLSEDELAYLGWSELDDGLRLVEWPERVAGLEEQADVRFEFAYSGRGRDVAIHAGSERGRRLLCALAQAQD